MPTIKDVAKEAGVSIATVSYVLNKKNSFVSEETRRQVLETVERIGYRPNATARNLQANRTRLIGYSWHEVPQNHPMNYILDTFTYYLARAAEEAGHHVLTFTHALGKPQHAYNELIMTGRVDAFVLAGTIGDDQRIRFLLDENYPFVSFGRSNPDWDFPWVDTDGRQGVYEAARYLIELGHRRIAMVGWPEDSISGNFRLAGLVKALTEVGLPLRPEYVLRGEHIVESGRLALATWWQLPEAERPTAVVAVSDQVAIGVIQEAHHLGLTVGKDLSVVGFDDTPVGQYLTPPLTSLQQPIPEIAQALITMLGAVLLGKEPQPRRVLLPPRLIIRDSCGRID